MSFESLGLAPALLRALADQGYTQPTPIQAGAIPLVLEGHDLLAAAQTGTGKTAAFALPLLQYLSTAGATQTRELGGMFQLGSSSISGTRRPAASTCR